MTHLNEAFNALRALDEDVFSFDEEGAQKLKDFMDGDFVDDFEEIIDTEAETEEDVAESYVGKVILECDVCHSLIYKAPEEVSIDEETQSANTAEPCPYCQSIAGFTIVGQVENYCDDCEDEEVDEVEEVEDEVEIDVEEDELEEETMPELQQKKATPASAPKRIGESKVKNNRPSLKESLYDNLQQKKLTPSSKAEKIREAEKHTISKEMLARLRDKKRANVKAPDDKIEERKDDNLKEGVEETKAFIASFPKMDVYDLKKWYKEYKNSTHSIDKRVENALKKEMVRRGLLKEACGKKGKNRPAKKMEEDLKIISDISEYTPWSGAVSTWERIEEEGLIDELDSLLEEAYPDGLTSTELNDILWFDDEWVFDMLGISDEEEEEEIEEAWVRGPRGEFKVSEKTRKELEKEGYGWHHTFEDGDKVYDVMVKDNSAVACLKESIKEDLERVDIETEDEKMSMRTEEDGKVVVETEPKHEEEEAEVIAPVEDEMRAEIESEEDEEEMDIDVEEFDEEEFDELGESYLKEVYDNVQSFKTSNGYIKNNKLALEGIITFNSGKKVKTSFLFEKFEVTKSGKVKLIGENRQFSTSKKAFTITGKMNGSKLLAESFNYNYLAKDSKTGKGKKVYGTVKKK